MECLIDRCGFQIRVQRDQVSESRVRRPDAPVTARSPVVDTKRPAVAVEPARLTRKAVLCETPFRRVGHQAIALDGIGDRLIDWRAVGEQPLEVVMATNWSRYYHARPARSQGRSATHSSMLL